MNRIVSVVSTNDETIYNTDPNRFMDYKFESLITYDNLIDLSNKYPNPKNKDFVDLSACIKYPFVLCYENGLNGEREDGYRIKFLTEDDKNMFISENSCLQ